MFYYFRSRWSTFIHNYCWSDWVTYIDGWIPRFSLFFPVLGYLILFNDSVGESIEFNILTNELIDWGLTGKERLRFLYFGLFFLGVSNFFYRIKRPYLFMFGTSIVDFTRVALDIFTYGDFLSMHRRIRSEGNIGRDGKYYDSNWDGFSEVANNTGEGTTSVQRDGNWEEAKKQYGDLLRSILREHFSSGDQGRRFWLTTCLALSTFGYLLLVIPGIDMFLKVTYSSFNFLQ